MKWVDALKKFNEGKKWSIPKKGSAEYEAVKKIMGTAGEGQGAEKTVVAKTAKGKKAVRVEEVAEVKSAPPMPKPRKSRGKKAPAEVHPKVRKPRAKKAAPVAADPSANAADVKPKMKRRAPAKAGSAPSDTLPQGVTARAVEHSSNPAAVLESMANSHLPIVPKETVPGLLIESTEKGNALPKPKHLPTLVDKEKVVDAAPFSFQKLRYTLGA